ncbi:MAG: TolC family protein [Planctomycetota bacterium]
MFKSQRHLSRPAAALTLIAAGFVTGCASDPFADVGAPQWSPTQTRPAAADTIADLPTGTLTLRDALAATLLHNPRLRAMTWEPRIAEARRLQAGLRPNPELEASLEGFGGSGELSGTDGAETTVSLSQVLELGGKRQRRVDVAQADRAVALAAYEAARLEVLTDTTLRYLRVLEMQRRVELAERAAALAGEASRTVERRVEAGDVSPIDATRARLERDSAAIRVDQLERRLRTARRELAAAWDQDEVTFGELTGELGPVAEVPTLTRLMTQLESHPNLRQAQEEIMRRRAAADLERSRAVPDVTVAVGGQYKGEVEEPGFVAGVSVPLPVFNRNQGNILAARLSAVQAVDTADAVRRDLALRLTRAHGDLDVAYQEARSVETQLLPAATAAFEATRRAYEEGKVAYVAVLEAQQTLFEIESRLVEAVSDYHRASAEVEGLTAAPLIEPSTQPTTRPSPSTQGEQP